MRSVTELKSLKDVKTTINAHGRSAPRQKESLHLEIYLLDKERQRLESEMAMLTKMVDRIERRLAEIRETMDRMLSKSQEKGHGPSPSMALAANEKRASGGHNSNPPRSRKMTLEY